MPLQQLREIVGKPLETSGHSTSWSYGRRSSSPEVRFNPTTINGYLGPLNVSDYDSDISNCRNDDDALIEVANGLSQKAPTTDKTNVTPLCAEAGISIQAYIEFGMTLAPGGTYVAGACKQRGVTI